MKEEKHEVQGNVYSCHVSPLPIKMKEHQLRHLFKDYSDLCGVYICHQKKKENIKYTYGFVRFKSQKSADHAVQYFTNLVNGWPLAVRHSKETLKQLTTMTDKSHSETPSFVLDEDYVKVFKQFSQTNCSKESFDSTLKTIKKHKVANFHPQSPTSALSVDLTETTTQNTDYKLWHTFFREQNYISKSLMEIIQSQESPDIANPSKSKSIIEEKDQVKDNCNNIKEIYPLTNQTHLEVTSIGPRNLCILDHGSKSDSKSRRQSSSSKEFIHSESEEEWEENDTTYIRKDQRPEYFDDDDDAEEEEEWDGSNHISENQRPKYFSENDDKEDYSDHIMRNDEKSRTNRSLLTEDLSPKRNSFSPKCYPIGRGMGLALAYQKLNLNPDASSTGFFKINSQFKNCDLKDSVRNTHLAKENIDESLESWDVFSDP